MWCREWWWQIDCKEFLFAEFFCEHSIDTIVGTELISGGLVYSNNTSKVGLMVGLLVWYIVQDNHQHNIVLGSDPIVIQKFFISKLGLTRRGFEGSFAILFICCTYLYQYDV